MPVVQRSATRTRSDRGEATDAQGHVGVIRGIRPLFNQDHHSFNPYNYQTGAVWPHDNSLIAMGMRRYGFAAEAAAVARDISGAASHFLLNQSPELYGGLRRESTRFPVPYLGANVPQAWAAGAPCCCRRCWGCSRTRREANYMSIRRYQLATRRDVDRSAARAAAFRYPFLAAGDKTQWQVLKGNRSMVASRSYVSGSRLL